LADAPRFFAARDRRYAVDHARNPACASGRWSAEKIRSGEDMSDDDVNEELSRLRAENERLKQQHARGLNLKVSEKGAVSVYGLGRFPVTLYKEQWLRLLDLGDQIRAFIRDNESKLKTKGDS
jgi:hypothetical protein